jgi:hypothetical protein
VRIDEEDDGESFLGKMEELLRTGSQFIEYREMEEKDKRVAMETQRWMEQENAERISPGIGI